MNWTTLGRSAALLALALSPVCSDAREAAPGQAAPSNGALGSTSEPLSAGISWPAEQLLPSFPTPAPTQDLITLRSQPQHWEAEGPSLAHKTGRAETDGWLCQVGIDKANDHLLYGPYDKTVPAGPNTAEFRLMTDNNSVDDASVVTLEVNDNTSGQVLASKTITRKQFAAANQYTTFSVPFTLAVWLCAWAPIQQRLQPTPRRS